ncbi:inovirus-type Gp2 protein [Buttiauxella sp. A111]|uniref:inovirus-type Gp2 protein n=1 Tax=Buttiauxella sp. A111 TaxID=2563088 RepID=UPI00161793DC|nr:inovirus-type Gp2 protein [Buttiauxella sp. A111]
MQHSPRTDTNLNDTHYRTLNRHLRHHLTKLFARYSKLIMLRVDLSYQLDSHSRDEGDIHSTVADMALLLQRSYDINVLVGYAWVLEYTEGHGMHIHAAFYMNAQKHRKVWPVFEKLKDIWLEVTEGEDVAFRCAPQSYYKVQGECVTPYHDLQGRKGMQYILNYLGKQS